MIKHLLLAAVLSISTLSVSAQNTPSLPGLPSPDVIQGQMERFKNQLRITPAQETLWNAYVRANMQTIDMNIQTELSSVTTVIELYDVLDRLQRNTSALFQVQRQATVNLYNVLTERQRTMLNSVVIQGGLSAGGPGLPSR